MKAIEILGDMHRSELGEWNISALLLLATVVVTVLILMGLAYLSGGASSGAGPENHCGFYAAGC